LRTLLEFMADDLPPIAHARIAPDGFDPWREAMRTLQAYEVWHTFGEVVRKHKPKFGPGVRERMEFAATVTKEAHDTAAVTRRKMVEHVMQTAMAGTIMALPSAPSIAPRIDSTEAELDQFR